MQISRIQTTPQNRPVQPNFKGFVGVKIIDSKVLGQRYTPMCDKFIDQIIHIRKSDPKNEISHVVYKKPDSTYVAAYFPVGFESKESDFKTAAEVISKYNPDGVKAKTIAGHYMDVQQEFLDFLNDK